MDGKEIISNSILKEVHHSLRKKPTDHPLHFLEVLKWIKYNKELVSVYRKQERQKIKGSLAKRISCEGYIKHMRHYLRHGDWIDNFYGADQEFQTRWVEIS